MSTVKAINLTHPSASTGLSLDANGNATVAGTLVAGSSMGWRNRIINGDMRIDQRNSGASVTPTNGQYTLDRWYGSLTQASKFTVQQSTVAPSGFTNSMLVTVSSAATVGSGDVFLIGHRIEGYNVADFGWGTAAAQTVTLSFWVRSSVTGTYGVGFQNGATNRSYVGTYTVNAANTWEQKSITVPGDTGGTWVTNNGLGLLIGFALGSGSTWETTAGSWASGAFYGTSSTVDWIGTNGATFYLTGVQLEPGTVATPFERRDYGRELMMCQRYYCTDFNGQTGQCWSSTEGGMTFSFPVSMRANPTLSYTGGSVTIDVIGGSQNAQMDALGANGSVNQYGARVYNMSSRTQWQLILLQSDNVSFSAEL